jgi:N-alpha-acetyl-L-2,4-diaminobutyrate deacetylase
MEAFNAPYGMMLLEIDMAGMYDEVAEAMGKVFVSTELGGGGSATAKSIAIAKRGVANFLKHAGIMAGAPERGPSVRLDMPDGRCFVTSESRGLIEFAVDLGETVAEGDVVARVHDVERTGGAPAEYRAKRDGILAGRHYPGLVGMGDCIAVVAEVVG